MAISTENPCPAGVTDENLHAIFIGYKPHPFFQHVLPGHTNPATPASSNIGTPRTNAKNTRGPAKPGTNIPFYPPGPTYRYLNTGEAGTALVDATALGLLRAAWSIFFDIRTQQ